MPDEYQKMTNSEDPRWPTPASESDNHQSTTAAVLPVILSRTSLQDSISPMLPNKLLSSSWVMF